MLGGGGNYSNALTKLLASDEVFYLFLSLTLGLWLGSYLPYKAGHYDL